MGWLLACANSPVGAGLPAIVGAWQCPLTGTIRLQASSHKDKLPPAFEFLRLCHAVQVVVFKTYF
jgi:hypothetical protein